MNEMCFQSESQYDGFRTKPKSKLGAKAMRLKCHLVDAYLAFTPAPHSPQDPGAPLRL